MKISENSWSSIFCLPFFFMRINNKKIVLRLCLIFFRNAPYFHVMIFFSQINLKNLKKLFWSFWSWIVFHVALFVSGCSWVYHIYNLFLYKSVLLMIFADANLRAHVCVFIFLLKKLLFDIRISIPIFFYADLPNLFSKFHYIFS